MGKHYKKIRIKEMCQIMEIPFPDRLKKIENVEIEHISLLAKHVEPGSAYIICTEDLDVPKTLDLAIKRKASVIFIPRKAFSECALNENDYPVIFTDNWLIQMGKLFSTIRCSYPASTVAITGTVGKTTTKEFLSTILKKQQKIYCNNGNRNSFLSVAKHITEELSDDTQTYIQEIGAGTPLSIEKSAVMLKPDYFVLLNVKNHHLNTYNTFDALFDDKTSVDKHMPENGIIITNFDDKAIASHQFIHPVISFGIDTEKEVDYRAVNITEKNGKLEFDIISKSKSTHIAINILGKHNVYNAMAAFITARQLGIPDKKIANRLRLYTPCGIRQNYVNVGGYHLYVDCYNVAFDSISAGIESMSNFALAEGGRRFAVIGGENKLGPDAPSLSYQFGQQISDANVDYFYCFGREERTEESLNIYGDGKSVCDGINDRKKGKAEFISDPQILIERLKENIKRNDMVFFKGIYLLDMPYIIDMIFGSAFTAQSEHYTKDAQFLKSKGLRFRKLPVGDKIELSGSAINRLILRIPDTAHGYSVYHISKNAFANDKLMRKIIFGRNIMHIDIGAFQGCSSLKTLHIPSNVKVLKSKVFSDCLNLKQVVMDEGVRHIGKHAFKNCDRLNKVWLPESIGYIDATAFEDCPDLLIHCPQNSYAETFARENNFNYISIS